MPGSRSRNWACGMRWKKTTRSSPARTFASPWRMSNAAKSKPASFMRRTPRSPTKWPRCFLLARPITIRSGIPWCCSRKRRKTQPRARSSNSCKPPRPRTFSPSTAFPFWTASERMDDWLLTPGEWSAVALSLKVALTATVVSLPFGIGLGYFLARKQFPGKSLVETVLSLPLVLPPVVTGYLLLILLGRRGWIGAYLDEWFGLQLVFTWKAAAVASAVMAFPLMVRAIRVAFGEVDRRLELAARTLGAGPMETFVRISLPLARRGISAGAVLAFARSMGQFGATVM